MGNYWSIHYIEILFRRVAASSNKPLYKVQQWLSRYSDGFDGKPLAANHFNDNRLARALSALFDSDRHSLMSEVSANAVCVHKLLTDEIHNDSTTVTFIGKYDTPEPEAVKLKHGHNKDFRPDCKQVLFGLNITADGHVPISYKLFDGNTTDDVTHIPNWNVLRTLLEKEDFIYVADCKLCNQKNLVHISENGGYFITIVPKDRKEFKQFLKHLKGNDVPWEDAFSIESSRKKGIFNVYKTYEHGPTKQGFRIIFVHSSLKQKDDEDRRSKKIDRAIANTLPAPLFSLADWERAPLSSTRTFINFDRCPTPAYLQGNVWISQVPELPL